ncbi:MAG: class I SAM-dependent methyltransferase [Lachnospiraceae bacterium]|nr:class I SAM-dependent methyltransferase [Lachnospiraceae bacterium]
MLNEQTSYWTAQYLRTEKMAYPAEYVIRMFKGKFPKLDLKKELGGYDDKSILDIGCGDGRHLCFFKEQGFKEICGTEISEEIVKKLKKDLENIGEFDIRVGVNNNLGFEDDKFDCLLSWNVCYYLDDKMDFVSHINEYARVLKKDGILVFSIPCKDCFVYKDGIEKDGFMEIRNDYFKIRNGSIQKIFQNEEDIEKTFGEKFKDFVFGKIDCDCFGLDYKWYIGYCRKI